MSKLPKSEYEKQTEEYESAFLSAMAVRRMKQNSFAKKLGKSQATVSKRLSDLDNVKLRDLREMAKVLGLKIKIE